MSIWRLQREDGLTVLIAGWFSFEDGHATAGDVLAARVIQMWLDDARFDHDLATASLFEGVVHWSRVDPAKYKVVIFVCGPFGALRNESEFFRRFAKSMIVGVDLSMPELPELWNPFDFLIERDSPTTGRPDLAFASRDDTVPVVGVCLVEDYPGGLTAPAHEAILRLLERFEVARVRVDTRLDVNTTGLRTEREVESLLAATDMVVTTRLHGMVFSLKHGIPVLPVDPAPGGGKIMRQAETLGWPVCFEVNELDDAALDAAFRYCLGEEARHRAVECTGRAQAGIKRIETELLAALCGGEVMRTPLSLRDQSRDRLSKALAVRAGGMDLLPTLVRRLRGWFSE